MRWNILKALRERRARKRKMREERRLLQTWRWLERMFETGMLSFDEKQHRLFILQPLAVLLMAHGAEGWVNSIHAIYQYTYFRQCQKAWEEYIGKEELEEVRRKMEGANLTREDIERIKRARRKEIAFSDMEAPEVEAFEFFIIPDSTDAKVEPVAVGHYDPATEQMEVATWEEVQRLMA